MVPSTNVTFDMFLFQDQPWPIMLDSVRYLEACGFGTVWVADQYAWPPQPNTPLLEAWTTLAALASATQRIRLGTCVTNVPLRHPAIVAKLAATVDCISGGRLDLGLGAGNWFQTEYAWLDVPHLAPSAAVTRFAEAVEITDRLLCEHRLSFDGTYYHLADAPLVPLPVQQPRPPLLLAANGSKALQVVAKFADIWVSIDKTVAEVRACNARLDEYCVALGRDPATLERAYFGTDNEDRPFASADALHEFVGRYHEAGIRRFIFVYATDTHPENLSYSEGRSATRVILDAFALQTMEALRDVQNHQG